MPISTIPAAGLSSGVPTRAQLPAGCILQVVQGVYSGTAVTATNSTPLDTGLSASITPTSTSSKILVLCNPNWSVNSAGTNNGTALGYIYRNAGAVYSMYNRNYNYNNSSGLYHNVPASLIYLDSPATTASVTYKFYIALITGSSTQLQGDGGNSSITLMEVAA
jgi:hypothetical protein